VQLGYFGMAGQLFWVGDVREESLLNPGKRKDESALGARLSKLNQNRNFREGDRCNRGGRRSIRKEYVDTLKRYFPDRC
jgi:hypothetical protein